MKAKMLLLIALFCCSASAFAQSGNAGLDLSFAKGGILIDTSYSSYISVKDLKLRPDGKIIVLSSGTYIARYQPNGTPDSLFGTNGSRWLDSFAKAKELYGAVCKLQPDKKILIAGSTYEFISPLHVWGGFVMRLNADGTIDSAFGHNGIQYSRDETTQLCLKPNGSIVTAGEGPIDKVFVNGFKANGAVDSAFGINGLCQLNLGDRPSFAGLGALADGGVAVVGMKRGSIFYIRLFANGQPDSAFCGTGVCYTAGALYCRDAIIFPDGKALITVGGLDDNSSFVARLKANATPDSSFGVEGDGNLAVPGLRIIRLLQMPDGRIICAGMWNEHYAVARVLKDGNGIDTTFGNKGIITTNVAGAHSERISAVELQTDGKIVAGGICFVRESDPKYWDPAPGIVRYLPDASLGINETPQPAKGTLKVYPNPANTSLTVVVPAPGLLQLFSIEGRLVKEQQCTGLVQGLDIVSLPQGVYLLRLQAADGSHSSLFTKE